MKSVASINECKNRFLTQAVFVIVTPYFCIQCRHTNCLCIAPGQGSVSCIIWSQFCCTQETKWERISTIAS